MYAPDSNNFEMQNKLSFEYLKRKLRVVISKHLFRVHCFTKILNNTRNKQ